jgi:hypothetical protein
MRAALLLVCAVGCGDGAAAGDGGDGPSDAIGLAACLRAAACGMSKDVSSCTADVAGVQALRFAEAAGFTAQVVRCLGDARTCDDARRCLNGGVAPTACSPFSPGTCSGNALVGCSEAAGRGMGDFGTTRTDCAAFGQTCVAGPSGASCGISSCPAMTKDVCMGAVLETCDSGVLHRLDCAAYGADCVDDGMRARCRGRGEACEGLAGPMQGLRCDGSVQVMCWDGREATWDCAQAGLVCAANARPEPFACALGAECDPRTFGATCKGASLELCQAGRIVQARCAQLGFGACESASDAGVSVARCADASAR